MKKRITLVAAALLMALTSMVFLTGCNTWEGLGKDVEKTGEAMQ